MSRKGVGTGVLVVIVLIILGAVISAGLIFTLRDGPIQDAIDHLFRQTDNEKYEQNCTLLYTEDNDFKKNAEDVFNAVLEYDVDEIPYFALFFKENWVGTDWYLEWWTVECDGTEGARNLMRYGTGKWISDKTAFAKTENKGYDAGLGCGNKVRVVTKTGDAWWSGTGGKVLLCYYRERPKRGE